MRITRRDLLRQAGTAAVGMHAASLLISRTSTGAEAGSIPALPRSTPAQQGVASAGVMGFLDAVEAASLNLHSLMIVRHGQVVAEGWWAPYAAGLKHTLYSLSKSFSSTAIGLAVDEGKLKLSDKVVSFFPDEVPATVSDNLAAMTVQDLLMMGTGHGQDALFEPGFMLPKRNWVEAILSRPVEHKPGTHFTYNNGSSYLLSAVLQQATGQTQLEFLTPRLFKPLGITEADWEVNPQGRNTGGWGLRVKTEDIAKLGLLYLNRGSWDGQRILSEEWVSAATSLQIENAPANDEERRRTSDWAQGYGYQFWRSRHDCYRGDGAFGQFCIVLPKQDTVIAMTSETGDLQGVLNAVWKHLLPALDGTPTGDQDAALQQKLTSLSLPLPVGQPTSPTIAGDRTFAMAQNPLGATRISLSLAADKCTFKVHDAQGEHLIHCGVGHWLTGATDFSPTALHLVSLGLPKDPPTTPLAAAAAWKDEKTLEMHWRFIETAHYQRVVCRFDGDKINVELTRSQSILNPNSFDPLPELTGTSV